MRPSHIHACVMVAAYKHVKMMKSLILIMNLGIFKCRIIPFIVYSTKRIGIHHLLQQMPIVKLHLSGIIYTWLEIIMLQILPISV